MNDEEKPPFVMNDKLYDIAKWVVIIVLPALGTLYYALAGIWGFGSGNDVVGTIIAIQAFLGVLMGISHISYKNSDARFDGTIKVHTNEHGRKVASLEVNGDPHKMLETKKEAVFKVDKPEGVV